MGGVYLGVLDQFSCVGEGGGVIFGGVGPIFFGGEGVVELD